MPECISPAAERQEEDFLKRGKFLLQEALMREMLPKFGLSEADWAAHGYAKVFHEAYLVEGGGWWERYQNGERDRVLKEAQERVLDGLRSSLH